jgi:hypothetical protein
MIVVLGQVIRQMSLGIEYDVDFRIAIHPPNCVDYPEDVPGTTPHPQHGGHTQHGPVTCVSIGRRIEPTTSGSI